MQPISQSKKNQGQKLVKGAVIDGLTAVLSFIGASKSVVTGNLYTGFALATFTGLQADKALIQAKEAIITIFLMKTKSPTR